MDVYLFPIRLQYARHELGLAMLSDVIANHALLVGELVIQAKRILPIEDWFGGALRSEASLRCAALRDGAAARPRSERGAASEHVIDSE